MEILETFPRVFCFPKSRINENDGDCKPWRMHRPSNSFPLSCKKPFKPCLYYNCYFITKSVIYIVHVWLKAFRKSPLFLKQDFCKKKNSLPFDCKLWFTISKEITVISTWLQLSRVMNKNWMYVHFKKIHSSQLYHELNYSFLFHWQYFFVVPKEKEIKNIDGRSYTAETQTSDTCISIQVWGVSKTQTSKLQTSDL